MEPPLLTCPFLLTQAMLPVMRTQQWGRIINILSFNGKRGDPGKVTSCSAKHGLIGLTWVAALETATDGITVSAICPGLVDTPLTARQLGDLVSLHGIAEDEVIDRIFPPGSRRIDYSIPAKLPQWCGIWHLMRHEESPARSSTCGRIHHALSLQII